MTGKKLFYYCFPLGTALPGPKWVNAKPTPNTCWYIVLWLAESVTQNAKIFILIVPLGPHEANAAPTQST